nr:macro domain-containing protein [uncultured Actinoplanes sp.]
MVELRYVIGDATDPRAEGPKIIAHVCNDIGAWGKGIVVAISRRWPAPERAFRGAGLALGETQLVPVEADLWVANMVGQHGIHRRAAGPPIRYQALATCLATVAGHARRLGASVHMPRIGAGLAGGDWSRIEPMIVASLCAQDVDTTVYDLAG